jgi:DeoR family fructose operon transcriptional repressor
VIKVFNPERHELILRILNEKGAVSVAELTETLGVSESTVRRDLVELSEAGVLNKVHGGATLNKRQYIMTEDTVNDKREKNVCEKRKIAEYAAKQINDSDFVYIDAGTSTLFMVDYLPKDLKATFVTNGISHAKLLAKRNYKAVIIGGQLKSTTEAVIGLSAANNLQNYNFTKAFLGTNGITENQGYSTPDSDEAFVKSAAIIQRFVEFVFS